jgi:hypothetical protein
MSKAPAPADSKNAILTPNQQISAFQKLMQWTWYFSGTAIILFIFVAGVIPAIAALFGKGDDYLLWLRKVRASEAGYQVSSQITWNIQGSASSAAGVVVWPDHIQAAYDIVGAIIPPKAAEDRKGILLDAQTDVRSEDVEVTQRSSNNGDSVVEDMAQHDDVALSENAAHKHQDAVGGSSADKMLGTMNNSLSRFGQDLYLPIVREILMIAIIRMGTVLIAIPVVIASLSCAFFLGEAYSRAMALEMYPFYPERAMMAYKATSFWPPLFAAIPFMVVPLPTAFLVVLCMIGLLVSMALFRANMIEF